jgi:cytochrome c556
LAYCAAASPGAGNKRYSTLFDKRLSTVVEFGRQPEHRRGDYSMMRTVLAMAAIAVGVTAVVAQSDPLAVRKALMKANQQNATALNKMVRGEDPFDAAKVNTAFATWSENAPKITSLYTTPPKPGEDSRALPKIWETKSDFDAKAATFTKAVADNKDKAKSLDELKVAFPAVNKTCNDCHELYRRPQQPR